MNKYVMILLLLLPYILLADDSGPIKVVNKNTFLSILSNDSLSESKKTEYIIEIITNSSKKEVASNIIIMYQTFEKHIARHTETVKECFVDKRKKLNEVKKEYMTKELEFKKNEVELWSHFQEEMKVKEQECRKREEKLEKMLQSDPHIYEEKTRLELRR